MSRRLGERYEIGATLGGGGTAVVSLAHDWTTGQGVAIKQLRPQFAAHAQLRRRFLREAALACELVHPGIVAVLDGGEDNGLPYLVMERVPGETLRARLDRTGPLPAGTAMAFGCRLCEALAFAHAHGVIHRDLKPQNVFLLDGPDASLPPGTVKIGDFGNARVMAMASLTGSSTTWGSPEYMAPEVFAHARADPRGDLYSLGVLLFETLTGRVPFSRQEALARLTLAKSARGPAVLAATGAAPHVDRLLAALLSPQLSDRPASASEVLARLGETGALVLEDRRIACSRCGAPRPQDIPRCPSCGQEALQLVHTSHGDWRVVLRHLDDDVEATWRLLRVLDEIALPGPPNLLFLTGEGTLYTEAEKKRGIQFPTVLFRQLDELTARTIERVLIAQGLDVEALPDGKRRRTSRAWLSQKRLLGAIAPSLGTMAVLAGVVIGPMAAAAAFVVGGGVAFMLWPSEKVNNLSGLFRLREGLAVVPAADSLLDGLLATAARMKSPEPRALLTDVAIELHRLARRAGADPSATATPVVSPGVQDVSARVLAAAPALATRVRALAGRLDELDAALNRETEGELLQTLARLQRQAAGAAATDAPTLSRTIKELEAALEARQAADFEHARLTAHLCELLTSLRQVLQRAGALHAPDHEEAQTLEIATAEIDRLMSPQQA